MDEIWKDIEGYEGLYQISNLGRVKSLGNDKTRKEKILKLRKDRDGYLRVCVSKYGKHNLFGVHRLVAKAFIQNIDNLPCVNHKDENKENNCADNLEFCTIEYNNNYGNHQLICAKSRQKKVLQFDLQGNFIKEWESLSECGNGGYTLGRISNCCNGKLKTHKGFIWKYKKDVV